MTVKIITKIKILLFSLSILCLGYVLINPIVSALNTASCDFSLIAPRSVLKEWNANQNKITPLKEWLQLEQQFKKQLAACPCHPQISSDLANLYMLRAMHASAVPGVQHFYEEIALTHLQTSLKYRPAMAQSWANIAMLKASLGQFDAQFDAALHNALLLAPHSMDIIQTLLVTKNLAKTSMSKVQFLQIQTAYQSLLPSQQEQLRPLLDVPR